MSKVPAHKNWWRCWLENTYRADEKTCRTCRFFFPQIGDGDETVQTYHTGKCRRFPPPNAGYTAQFPMVMEIDWCGEWKQAEVRDGNV